MLLGVSGSAFNTSEILSNLTTTNKSSLVGAINELNSNTRFDVTVPDNVSILCVPESRDAVGVYVDYFKPTVTAFRYKNDSFELII